MILQEAKKYFTYVNMFNEKRARNIKTSVEYGKLIDEDFILYCNIPYKDRTKIYCCFFNVMIV